ncbi:MAG TPA: UDP binding domain-containing protein, partial [Campylobacterales bacterium]|nr:UDP binding domain-containing protein [Campylobacterales bacterium]
QRDINIAFVNELSLIFNKMGIDTIDVLEAAGTKWNFLPFRPGLVGGHCIGVDPYYLTFKAESLGYYPEVILSGRRINDNMGAYVAKEIVKLLIKKSFKVDGAKVLVLGITFKENCPDIRNSRVVDVISELKDFGCITDIYDPWADSAEVEHEYGVSLVKEPANDYDAVVLAVAHKEFRALDINSLKKEGAVVYDIKGFLPKGVADKRL